MSSHFDYLEPAHFDALAAPLLQPDAALDRCTLHLRAEASDFLRFNGSALRQATAVQQAYATLAVERGQRRSEVTLSLGGALHEDIRRLQAERDQLVAQLDLIADDPWLQAPGAPALSRRDEPGALAPAAQVIALVHAQAQARQVDLVGFYAAGPVAHAFADSQGSRHWHRVESFHFEWCLYHHADKAVKALYAGSHWDDAEFTRRLDQAAARVRLLARPARTLPPGCYRAALAPMAMAELLQLLGWDGFSLKARHTGVSPLMRLQRGEASFAPGIHLSEALGRSSAPAFSAEGFVRPSEQVLVAEGRLPADGGTLNSPRSAREYGVATNGADSRESPLALALRGGGIADDQLLAVLGTGLYISNLWYLNYSDRARCRMTGMTRYACFWVEGGELVEPVNVMRFDDDGLRLLGAGLVGLTTTAELIPNGDTYGARALGSVSTPAAVVEALRLTL